VPIDPASDMRLEAGIALHVDRTGRKEAAVTEIAQPGGKTEAEEIEERKDDPVLPMVTTLLANCEGPRLR
jgi:hypothetical protein